MSNEREAIWRGFDELGVEEVRKRLGARQYGEPKEWMAREWLSHYDALSALEDRRKAISAADEANELTRKANSLADEANKSAREAAASAREAVEAAREANAFAQLANTIASDAAAFARLSADAARTNNMITTSALIAAVIAMAISILGIFIKR